MIITEIQMQIQGSSSVRLTSGIGHPAVGEHSSENALVITDAQDAIRLISDQTNCILSIQPSTLI